MTKNILYFSYFIITCTNLLSQSLGYQEQMRQYKEIIMQEEKIENDIEANYDFEQSNNLKHKTSAQLDCLAFTEFLSATIFLNILFHHYISLRYCKG